MRCKVCGTKVSMFKMNDGLCPTCYQERKREETERRAQREKEAQQAEEREKALHKEIEGFYELIAKKLEDIEAEKINVDDTPVTGTEAAIKLINERCNLCFEIKDTVQKLYDYPADVVMQVIIKHSTLERSGICYRSNAVICFFYTPLDANTVISKFIEAVKKSGDENWHKYYTLGRSFRARLKFERALADLQPIAPEANDPDKYPRLKGSEIPMIRMSRLASNTDRDALANFVAIYVEAQSRAPYVKIKTIEAVRFIDWVPDERLVLHFDVENKKAEQFSSYIDALKQFIGGFMIVSYNTTKMFDAFYYNGYNLREGYSRRKYYDVSILAESYRIKVNGFYGTDIDSLCDATNLRFKYMEKPVGADSMALGYLFKFYVYGY